MRAQKGSRSTALLILNLGARYGCVGQGHAPAALPPGKTRYPLYRRLGGPQVLFGWVWRRENIWPLPEFES